MTVGFYAVSLKVILQYDDADLSWYDAFTVASTVAPSDPVAVVSLLGELGAPVTLSTLIEGESLTNDGSGVVVFSIFSDLSLGAELSVGDAFVRFIRLAGGGIVLGILFGIVGTYLFKKFHRDSIILTTITFILAYASFYIAENTEVHVSGVLTTVSMGIYLSAYAKVKLSRIILREVLTVWTWGQYVVETLIFFLAGALIGVQIEQAQEFVEDKDWWRMALFYILMNLGRFIVVFILKPILNHTSYGLNWREAIILGYGALRGALGLALALLINVNSEYPERLRRIVLFYASSMAVGTLFINAVTAEFIVKKLKITRVPMIKRKIIQNLYGQLALETNQNIAKLQFDKHLALCDWDRVREIAAYDVLLQKTYEDITLTGKKRRLKPTERSSKEKRDPWQIIRQQFLSRAALCRFSVHEIEQESRFRLLTMFRGLLVEKHEEGVISNDSARAMIEAINFNLDDPDKPLWFWEVLMKHFYHVKIMNFMLKMRNWKLGIGKLVRFYIGNRLYFIYDCTSAIVMISDELLQQQTEVPVQQQNISGVIDELARTKIKAEAYIEELNARFVGVIRDVQVRRASSRILYRNKQLLKKFLRDGKITEKEHGKMIKDVEEAIINMHKIHYDWSGEQDISNFIMKFPIFRNLLPNQVRELKKQCELAKYDSRRVIVEKDQRLEYVYIVACGALVEYFGDQRSVRSNIGSLVNVTNLILARDHAAFSIYTQSERCAVYKVSISFIKALMSQNKRFEESVYKHSLFTLIRLYRSRAGELNYLSQDELIVHHLSYESTLSDYKVDEEFSLDFGGYVFSGEAKILDKKVTDSFKKQEKLYFSKDFAGENEDYWSDTDESVEERIIRSEFGRQHSKNSGKQEEARGELKDMKHQKSTGIRSDIVYKEYTYVPSTTQIVKAVENLRILKFNDKITHLTGPSGENLVQKRIAVATQKSGKGRKQPATLNQVEGAMNVQLMENLKFDQSIHRCLMKHVRRLGYRVEKDPVKERPKFASTVMELAGMNRSQLKWNKSHDSKQDQHIVNKRLDDEFQRRNDAIQARNGEGLSPVNNENKHGNLKIPEENSIKQEADKAIFEVPSDDRSVPSEDIVVSLNKNIPTQRQMH